MRNNQQGFTLIELIVVIVILGILAATALPKFIDLRTDAGNAAIQGVAGGISSAFAVNYGGYVVNTSKGAAIAGTVDVAGAIGSVLAGGMPAGYGVATAGVSVTCGTAGLGVPITISNSSLAGSTSAAATLICTG